MRKAFWVLGLALLVAIVLSAVVDADFPPLRPIDVWGEVAFPVGATIEVKVRVASGISWENSVWSSVVAKTEVRHCGCWFKGEYLGNVYGLDVPRDDPETPELDGLVPNSLIYVYIDGIVRRVQAWGGEDALRLDIYPGLMLGPELIELADLPAVLPECGGQKKIGDFKPPIERPD